MTTTTIDRLEVLASDLAIGNIIDLGDGIERQIDAISTFHNSLWFRYFIVGNPRRTNDCFRAPTATMTAVVK